MQQPLLLFFLLIIRAPVQHGASVVVQSTSTIRNGGERTDGRAVAADGE